MIDLIKDIYKVVPDFLKKREFKKIRKALWEKHEIRFTGVIGLVGIGIIKADIHATQLDAATGVLKIRSYTTRDGTTTVKYPMITHEISISVLYDLILCSKPYKIKYNKINLNDPSFGFVGV